MKLINYFLGFNAAALAYTAFTQLVCSMDCEVYKWILSCLAFSILSSTAIYNLIQGYKLHKKEMI
jgi:hypothetical protein